MEIIDLSQTILIGYSLGGSFLIRYCSENDISSIHSIHFVATPISRQLPEETLTSGFYSEPKKIETLTNYGSKLYFHNSVDDTTVPLSEMEKTKALLPDAHYHVYTDKNGHFIVEEFPELAELLVQ